MAVYILVVGCLFAGLRLADGALAAQQDERPAAQTAGQEAEARKTGYDGPSSAGDWNLVLINRDNPLPEGYEVTTAPLAGGQAVDDRCLADLQAMMDDCRAAGSSRSSARPTARRTSSRSFSTSRFEYWNPEDSQKGKHGRKRVRLSHFLAQVSISSV